MICVYLNLLYIQRILNAFLQHLTKIYLLAATYENEY